jgi:glucosamine--fructose-6-phosphate aminotransferase (isomerizing)
MCCLFGLIDTELRFTGKEKSKMLHVLASASEARGTDATGVAYDSGRNLHIYKQPIPGHKLNFYIRDNSRFAMGHTRMTTQGSARRNYNNHPFRGIMQAGTFALAHNGVLDNDLSLRKSLHLPRTRIETDSFIAVQLIEQKGILIFDSLRYMAELLEGSFTITVLGDDGDLYIVKGDNPFCLYFFPDCGLYLYASTEEILRQALRKIQVSLGKSRKVSIQCGEILRINQTGRLDRETFDDSKLFRCRYPRFLMNDPY